MKIEEHKDWVQEVWNKIDTKMQKIAVRSKYKLPYTTKEGIHDDCSKENTSWWTNGFWPGMMWLLYVDTQNNQYKKTAEEGEHLLDKALVQYESLHHDVGFMWHISSGTNYRLTGNKASKVRAMYAANILAARYNIKGGYIRAWNDDIEGDLNIGWAIIDCMMNIPILYWASEECKDPRYEYIARAHANKTMKYHVREDGSVKHIVEYDSETGDLVKEIGGQGYAEYSSWSRGAILGTLWIYLKLSIYKRHKLLKYS